MTDNDNQKDSRKNFSAKKNKEGGASVNKESKKGKDESDFKLDDQPKGPIGWDALKNEIKKDYTETEKQIAKKKKPEADKPKPVERQDEPSIDKPRLEKPLGPQDAPKPVERQDEPSIDKPRLEKPLEQPERQDEPKPDAEIFESKKAPSGEPKLSADDEKVNAPVEVSEPDIEKHARSEDIEERREAFRIISKYVIGGCVFLVIIVAIFFFQVHRGVTNYIRNIFTREETVVTDVTEDTLHDRVEVKTPSIQTSFIVGANRGIVPEGFKDIDRVPLPGEENFYEIKKLSPSVFAAFVLGMPEISIEDKDILASYMNVLMRLQNAFRTDLHQMLDNSMNRLETLDSHLNELETLQDEAKRTLEKINVKKDELKVRFDEVTELKNLAEREFFVAMENLEAKKANDLINNFIETSQIQIKLRAEYNALNKASSLFQTATRNMDARIKDIRLNREALVKGVRVVDIKGSDLDLIIREADL